MRISTTFLLLLFWVASQGQAIQCFTELDYYTNEPNARLIVVVPESMDGMAAELTIIGKYINARGQKELVAGTNGFQLALGNVPDTTHQLTIQLQAAMEVYTLSTILEKRAHRSNAVKINRLKGGLVVDDLPWFPFGFYCYSPVQPTLAEEEVVRGFNLFSPYQKIQLSTFAERKRYLDRCAALGMKVHYNLLSISGGGGVGSGRSNYSLEERLALLEREVNAVKNHPALLAWYMADEPTGRGVHPKELQPFYQKIKELDPYHPVSIAFLHEVAADSFRQVTDIVMADPYPVPNRPPLTVGKMTAKLLDLFRYQKPVWMIPQAFGGNEWWPREPSPAELRLMTYLPIVRGATGIQYFVRHGLNSFPKSTLAWDAASAIAKEVSDLTPFLLDYQESELVAQADTSLRVRWFLTPEELMVLVVNTQVHPKSFRVDLENEEWDGVAEVLFEQRGVRITAGQWPDFIEGYGRRVYRLPIAPRANIATIHPGNLILDPSFEESPVAGTPAACYTKIKDDRGATVTLDARTKVNGRFSLRLVSPAPEQGMEVTLFPVRLVPNQSYALSFFGKSLQDSLQLKMEIGGFEQQAFTVPPFWKEHRLLFHTGSILPEQSGTNVRFELISKGTAWIDLLQLRPEPALVYQPDIFAKSTEVVVESSLQDDPAISIHYTLDGSLPNVTSPPYSGPIRLQESTIVNACVVKGPQAWCSQTEVILNALSAQKVIYNNPYNGKYPASGPGGLIDGVLGSTRFTDGNWQGWNADDIDLLIDFGEKKAMRKLKLRFLQDHNAWIYLPRQIHLFASEDGLRFTKVGTIAPSQEPFTTEAKIIMLEQELGGAYRYIRVFAQRLATLPEDHPSSGGDPYVFMDEVIVEGN